MKKINFDETVEESVALVGLAASLYDGLDRAGAGSLLPPGKRAVDLHIDLIRHWQNQETGQSDRDGIYALFRRCREVINPIQSALQNLVRPANILKPIPLETGKAEDLLHAIVRAKENWAYIDAHPQIIIHKT